MLELKKEEKKGGWGGLSDYLIIQTYNKWLKICSDADDNNQKLV